MTQPLRLVHASDLHLELPVYGLAEVPDHLRDLLIEAPYHAAEQVFETALAEDVDAVLLAGDVLNVDRAGPPAIVLLLDQFARLAERGIPDLLGRRRGRCARLLAAQRFAAGKRARVSGRPRRIARPGARRRNDRPRARHELPRRRRRRSPRFSSRCAWPVHDRRRLRHERFGRPRRRPRPLHGPRRPAFAANGRRAAGHRPLLRHAARPRAHRNRPARLHGRHRRRNGPRENEIRRHRYRPLDRAIARSHGHDEVRATARPHGRAAGKAAGPAPGRRLVRALEHPRHRPARESPAAGSLADELLVDLRRKFGERSPVAWSVSITCDSPLSVPAEWYDQETCLGDFLRVVRDFELHETPFDLRPFLPEDVRDEFLESHRRRRIRRRARRTAVPRRRSSASIC